MIAAAITGAALVMMIAVAVYLVFSQHYEDGILGRAALTAVALAATSELLLMFAHRPSLDGPGVLLAWGAAAFLARHAWRAHGFSGACADRHSMPSREIPEFLKKT